MKKTRFTEEQMVTILREADEKPVPEVAKRHGVSAPDDLRVAKALRLAGARRRQAPPAVGAGKRSAEEARGRSRSGAPGPQGDLAKKMVGARVRRQQVAYAEGRGLSRRRACALLSVARSTIGYVSTLIARDAGVVPPMRIVGRAVSAVRLSHDPDLPRAPRPRPGRRPDVSAVAAGGLQVPKKRPRRRVAASRPRPLPPTAVNHVWAYDFVFDTCADGRSLKCLTVIDEFTRECLAIDVAGGIRSGRVIEVLTQLVSVHGAPRYLRSDNGPEFVARAILRWLQARPDQDGVHRPGQALAERRRRIVQREAARPASLAAVVPQSHGREGRASSSGGSITTRSGRTPVSGI